MAVVVGFFFFKRALWSVAVTFTRIALYKNIEKYPILNVKIYDFFFLNNIF